MNQKVENPPSLVRVVRRSCSDQSNLGFMYLAVGAWSEEARALDRHANEWEIWKHLGTPGLYFFFSEDPDLTDSCVMLTESKGGYGVL